MPLSPHCHVTSLLSIASSCIPGLRAENAASRGAIEPTAADDNKQNYIRRRFAQSTRFTFTFLFFAKLLRFP